MARRMLLWCLLALLILLCGFADSGGRAWMAGYERAASPQVHVKPIVALPGPGTNFGGVTRIWPFSSTNIWVQGSNNTPSMYEQYQQVTQHFDGSKWTSYLPTTIKYDAIVSSSTTNTWAIGSAEVGPHGYATEMGYLDYNGLSWQETPIQPLYAFAGLSALSATDAWISGTATTGEAIVEHWNGKKWQVIPLATYVPPDFDRNHDSDDAQNIFAFSPTDVWTLIFPAHTSEWTFEHWDGSKWTLYTTPQYLSQYESDVAPLPKEHALGIVTGNSTSQELVAFTP